MPSNERQLEADPTRFMALVMNILVNHAFIENLFDEDIPLERFTDWFCQATGRMFTSGPVHTKALFSHNSRDVNRGMRHIFKDGWHLAGEKVKPKHARFVSKIDRDVLYCSSATEFMSAFVDVVSAHYQGRTRSRWIHRDLTPMNIHVDDNGVGILIDWDIMEGYEKKTSENSRAG